MNKPLPPVEQPAAAPAPVPATAPAPAPAAAPQPQAQPQPQTAAPMREPTPPPRRSPGLKTLAFIALVVIPAALATFYMMVVASPQYHSRVAFSVRSLDASPAANILGMLSPGTSAGAEDALVLFEYLQSQSFVEAVDAKLPLEEIFATEKSDYLFGLAQESTIEAKTFYWNIASTITFDNTSRIIDVEIYAFSPEDARRLAAVVAAESESLVNKLSEAARRDAVRFAEEDVIEAEARLRAVRLQLSDFRTASQEVDPTANARLQYELVASLEASLANANAQLETQRAYLDEDAPPIKALKRRMASLEAQIEVERGKLAGGETAEGQADGSISTTLSVFEELSVEREFAETLYTASLTALSQAQTDARRSQRYLAVHISPTLANEALYPSRVLLSAAVLFGLLMLWGIGNLIIASVQARN